MTLWHFYENKRDKVIIGGPDPVIIRKLSLGINM